MLDLYTLRIRFASLSPLQLVIPPEEEGIWQHMAYFYTSGLETAPGEAAYFVTDEFLFFGKLCWKQTGQFLLLGPATEYPLSQDARQRIPLALKLRGREASELTAGLTEVPVMHFTEFLQQLSFLNYILNESQRVGGLLMEPPGREPPSQQPYRPRHNTAEMENYLLGCIEFGQVEELEAFLRSSQINQYTTGVDSGDSLRTQQNLFITSTTLSARAAVLGGLGYEQSMALSDTYLYQVEKLQTIPEVQQLLGRMMLDFAGRTAQLRLSGAVSQPVKAAVRQINERLYQKITARELADSVGVSRSHLSHLFRREMGVSLTDYIARLKIQEAIRLMKTTRLNLAEISCQLAFSSQSYFHATFKKITGINPGQYPRDHLGSIPSGTNGG